MIVHASRLFDPRAAELGPLDVTRKSGKEGLIWAPSWEILSPALKAFKAAQTIPEKNNAFVLYSIDYKAEMRESWKQNRAAWERVLRWEYPALDLEREHLTLQCYCVDHNYCHRTLLARDILPGACARKAPIQTPPTSPGMGICFHLLCPNASGPVSLSKTGDPSEIYTRTISLLNLGGPPRIKSTTTSSSPIHTLGMLITNPFNKKAPG